MAIDSPRSQEYGQRKVTGTWQPGWGFRRLDVTVSGIPSGPDTLGDAAALFAEETSEELGLYYEIVAERNFRSRQWQDLRERVDAVARMGVRRGFGGWWDRTRRLGTELREIAVALLQAETQLGLARRQAVEHIEDASQQAGAHLFLEILRRAVGDFERPDFPGMRAMVELLEHRHSRRAERAAVLVSGLIGGVAGAALTAIAGAD